jgi:RNA polymerase sigma factor (sigma-70 family)
MDTTSLTGILRQLRRAAILPDERSDRQLLESFLRQREETAFEALLQRHGPMVWGICRRVLRNDADAEDAFQATFLVLVGKAATIANGTAVGNWLYGVAHHTALKARELNGRRRVKEREAAARRPAEAADTIWQDLGALLDSELSRLPLKYRIPIVLCYLEGRPVREASRQLGCPQGTIASRLARGRALLARRLARRGLALSGGVLALLLSQITASAHVPPAVTIATIKAASWLASGRAAGEVSAHVAVLAEGVLSTMFLNRIKKTAAVVLAAGLLLVAGATAAFHGLAAEPGEQKEAGATRPAPAAAEKVGEVRVFEGHSAGILRVAFSPNGRLAASSSMSNTVRLWDVKTGKAVHVLEGHTDRVDCVTFSPDGKRLLSAAWDGTVRLWDVETGKELARFDTQGAPGVHVCNVIFFKDGKRFLWNAVDHHSLQIWDIESGQQVKEFGEHPDHVCAVALTPDGKRVLEGNWDTNLRLWDIESGQELRQFQGHTGAVYCVAVSPDGKLGLSCSVADTAVILWDLETGNELRRFQGHAEGLDFVAFSPDGRRALSCGQDKTIRLWEVATGKELHCFDSHTARVGCVAFSPDGRYALSGSEDHTVRLWQLPK